MLKESLPRQQNHCKEKSLTSEARPTLPFLPAFDYPETTDESSLGRCGLHPPFLPLTRRCRDPRHAQHGAQLTPEASHGPALLWLQTLGLRKLFLSTHYLPCLHCSSALALLPRWKGGTQSPGVQSPTSAPTSATATREGSRRST